MERFLSASNMDYPTALREIQNGRKESHWIWYIFPQLTILGKSDTATRYGLSGVDEARAFYDHPVLGARLREITQALLLQPKRNPYDVMDSAVDAKKLRSCMTLFEIAAPECPLFARVLEEFYNGVRDYRTLDEIL